MVSSKPQANPRIANAGAAKLGHLAAITQAQAGDLIFTGRQATTTYQEINGGASNPLAINRTGERFALQQVGIGPCLKLCGLSELVSAGREPGRRRNAQC